MYQKTMLTNKIDFAAISFIHTTHFAGPFLFPVVAQEFPWSVSQWFDKALSSWDHDMILDSNTK